MNVSQWSDLPLVLTSDQTAAVLQLKRRTIANMLDRGDLRGVKIGKEWRVSRAELIRFVEGNSRSKAQAETARRMEIEAEAASTADAWEHDSILSIIGLGAGGPPDLSSRHHEYLRVAETRGEDVPSVASPSIQEADWDAFDRLTEACAVRTGITDLAHQHDHYLYGKSKIE